MIGPRVRLLLIGINPGDRSAALARHFAGRGNRFWPALAAAGLVPPGTTALCQHILPDLGIGISNLVPRASRTAAQVSTAELRTGAAALVEKVVRWRPAVVAVLGLGAYRTAFARPGAVAGPVPAPEGAPGHWWLWHNPSGLNAHALPADHTAFLVTVGRQAGLRP